MFPWYQGNLNILIESNEKWFEKTSLQVNYEKMPWVIRNYENNCKITSVYKLGIMPEWRYKLKKEASALGNRTAKRDQVYCHEQ